MISRAKALQLRSMIERAAASLGDEDALQAVELFPVWAADGSYVAGDRVRYGGVLYRCLQEHEAQEAWTPGDAPSLWDKVLIPDPGEIPEWEQPGSTNGYAKDDRVRHSDRVWVSGLDNNVWEPGVYGWTEV